MFWHVSTADNMIGYNDIRQTNGQSNAALTRPVKITTRISGVCHVPNQ